MDRSADAPSTINAIATMPRALLKTDGFVRPPFERPPAALALFLGFLATTTEAFGWVFCFASMGTNILFDYRHPEGQVLRRLHILLSNSNA